MTSAMPRATSILAGVLLLSTAGRRDVLAQSACERSSLSAGDTAALDRFGSAIAVSGNRALVGAPDADLGGDVDAGAAYLFVRTGSTWAQEAKLTAFDASGHDRFGWAVALEGDLAVVGAPGKTRGGVPGAGAAYVYRRGPTGWAVEAKLLGAAGTGIGGAGTSVAVSGDLVVVGAPRDDVSGVHDCGSALLFRKTATGWAQEFRLVAGDSLADDHFGQSVHADGDVVAVGAPDADPAGISSGAAYLFRRAGGIWVQESRITALDAAAGDGFGSSVAISADALLSGAPGHAHAGVATGAAYLFRKSATWALEAELLAADLASGDGFGAAVALAGDLAAVGAPSADHAAGTNAGAGYVFRRVAGAWIELQKLATYGSDAGDALGASIAVDGEFVAAGAPLADDAALDGGAAHVFAVADDCNANLIPDVCDVLAGVEADCNGNQVPDACELRDCAGQPACDDCNLNGTIDVCDIAEGRLTDADGDGAPDECVSFVGLCPMNNDWSCVDNWNLGGIYPDNGPQTYSVTLQGPGDNVSLDLDVTIDTLRILQGAALTVADPLDGDLTIIKRGGVFLEGDPVDNEPSQLLAGNGRALFVPSGGFVLGPDAVYEAAWTSGRSTGSLLSAEQALILAGTCDCPDQTNGGAMILGSGMLVTIAGDFELRGADVAVCPMDCQNRRGGITPPPKLIGGTTAQVTVQGDFTVTGVVDVRFGESVRTAGVTPAELILGGAFNNLSQYPQRFDWTYGKLTLSGAQPQAVEVAGTDRGPGGDGYLVNFAMGTVEVLASRAVTFQDLLDNAPGGAVEALYVDTLILRALSHISIDDCKVYYNHLIDEGARIDLYGAGELLAVAQPPRLAAAPHDAPKNRYLSVVPANGALPVALKVVMTAGPTGGALPALAGWVDTPDGHGTARLVGAPVTRGWTEPLVHIGDCGIIPAATYAVTSTRDAGASYSVPLTAYTIARPAPKYWGDTVGELLGGQWTAPNGVVNMNDFVAALQKFQSLPQAPDLTVVDIQSTGAPNPCLNGAVNMADVFLLIHAYQGRPYPFVTNPADCPSCP
ncbi:MAG: FG-GAP repeat protein [Planctomycetes bacterium]|nr:FG-GAP repeat protein [Planctomycetota bacterium]